MSKLEDLLGKKKEVVPILDLSKTILNSKEEYKRISEKVPDYKMRPIKVGEVNLLQISTEISSTLNSKEKKQKHRTISPLAMN